MGIVPEPSTKLKELMKNIELKESSKSVEIPSKNIDDNEEIAPPSPYANNNEISSENRNDVIIDDVEKADEIISDDFVQASVELKEDNEEKNDEEGEVGFKPET